MLPTSDTIIFMFFTLILCGSMVYYSNRIVTYRNDERGISIIAKASIITFSSVLLVFALFMIYVAVIGMFDLDLHQTFSLIVIRNVVTIILAFIGVVNSVAIMYFEKHI